MLTLTQACASNRQPNDIWTGTLTFAPGAVGAPGPVSGNMVPLVVDIAAFKGPEDPHLFHNIYGTDGASLLLSAEGATNDRAWSSDHSQEMEIGIWNPRDSE